MACQDRATHIEPFRFLALPRELRDRVYEYIVPSKTYDCTDSCGQGARSRAGGLLRASRQTYEELIEACLRSSKKTLQQHANSGLSLTQYVLLAPFLDLLALETRIIRPTIRVSITNTFEVEGTVDSILCPLRYVICRLNLYFGIRHGSDMPFSDLLAELGEMFGWIFARSGSSKLWLAERFVRGSLDIFYDVLSMANYSHRHMT